MSEPGESWHEDDLGLDTSFDELRQRWAGMDGNSRFKWRRTIEKMARNRLEFQNKRANIQYEHDISDLIENLYGELHRDEQAKEKRAEAEKNAQEAFDRTMSKVHQMDHEAEVGRKQPQS